MSMTRRSLLSGLFVVAAFAQMQAASAQSFPRIGAFLLGAPQHYDQQEAQIAKLGAVFLDMPPGWRGSNGQTPQQVIAAIKALNHNIKVLLYTNINELQYPIPAGATSNLSPIDSTPWWLYTYKTTGSMVKSWYPGYYTVNTTQYTRPNSSGQRYLAWRAAYDDAELIKPNPSADGLFIDNVFWAPRVDGDWTLSGTIQLSTDAVTQQLYRNGMVAYMDQLKGLMGAGKYAAGNVADWGTTHPITGYPGVMEGGAMQSIIGETYSYEAWGGWAMMMGYYARVMNATTAPQLEIFDQNDTSSTDYQNMRYGLASCLVGGNGYFFFDVGNADNTLYFYDEYNSNLGAATTSPPTAAYQNGVWRRDFQNGIALVNPKGNGARTVTLETSYKHINGTQDPTVNNGTTVTQVTLNDRDGLILLRTTAAAATPTAPSSLTVH